VDGMLSAEPTIFFALQSVRGRAFILHRRIVSLPTSVTR
jgi:hypothetical protein